MTKRVMESLFFNGFVFFYGIVSLLFNTHNIPDVAKGCFVGQAKADHEEICLRVDQPT